jgi:hypothetical protein
VTDPSIRQKPPAEREGYYGYKDHLIIIVRMNVERKVQTVNEVSRPQSDEEESLLIRAKEAYAYEEIAIGHIPTTCSHLEPAFQKNGSFRISGMKVKPA